MHRAEDTPLPIGAIAAVILGVLLFGSVTLGSCDHKDDSAEPRATEQQARSNGDVEQHQQDAPTNSAAEQTPPPTPPDAKGRARIKFANVLDSIYKQEGRLISVYATDNKYTTLTLSSPLMSEGSYTLDAAHRETTECSECMLMMAKLGFKKLVITGARYNESVDLQN